MSHTDDLSPAFFAELKAVCSRLGCDPLDMLKVMFAEGGVKADAHNTASNASGLIQFMPNTLAGLGWSSDHSAFRQLRAEEQLPWVERFFQPFKSKQLTTVTRVYQAVFLPASLDAGATDDTVVCGEQGPFAAAYMSNRTVDRDGKGFISVGDLRAAVERRATGPRWEEIVARLKQGDEPQPVDGPTKEGQPTFVNGIAAGFDGLQLQEGAPVVVDARALFAVPATAKRLVIEIFRQSGRIEVFHGSGLYAGQVGWGGLPYLQLEVELDNAGRFSIRGAENAVLQRLGILAFH
jgi:hypothetical protein